MAQKLRNLIFFSSLIATLALANARTWTYVATAASAFVDDHSVSITVANGNGGLSPANAGQFSISAAQSVCLWARQTGGAVGFIAATADQVAGGGYNMFNNDAGGLQPEIDLVDASINFIRQRVTVSVSKNAWHFVCWTYSGANVSTALKVYIDGAAVATTDLSSAPSGILSTFNLATNKLCLGCQTNVATTRLIFNGDLDLFGQWNVELSAADITRLYASGAPYDYATDSKSGNVVLNYRIGEGADTNSSIVDVKSAQNLTCTNCTLGTAHP